MEFNIFCWNFAYVFYLVMSTKEYVGFFLFCLDLELLIKVQKQALNKVKKNSTHFFVDIGK